jgi:magnesium chelatase subunit I
VKQVFDDHFPAVGRALGSGGEDDRGAYAPIVQWFADGNSVELDDQQPFAEYLSQLERVPGLTELAADHGDRPETRALAAEMILEGLHQYVKLAREDLDSRVSYKEVVKFQLLRPRRESGEGDFQ